ncbi:chemokine XC receptor 1 [Pipistrellus kuhlii]|uniref:Chemokine C-C motif receptor-like 2 n=1 Tax=Pipistrellus kuhlii TaxID=59472 RepID=A0A7J7WF80_PIPKU|nr:chemokine XC receptor 1 [Pipistrellus kuhlii]XP_045435454.1 chemokine XC receptor 1 [Pipistrellus kuhlii]XP_045435455.1 chemokine XC receptor 1 [Pipistrellus kuhlii]KAF6336013.1 X-C motif chemokine receptor 1 [Pipistrellus kuhlii]
MEPSGIPETTTPYDYDSQSFLCDTQTFTFAAFNTTILYCLVFFLSLVGNILVLWVLVKYESLESLTNVFILNLCLSDLVFSFLLPLWALVYHWGWVLGDFFCKLSNMIFSISLFSSIFFLTIMTIHRYLSVVSPLSSLRVYTLQCRVLVTTAVWAVSILSSIPDAIFHKVFHDPESPSGFSRCDYSEVKWYLASVYQHIVFFLLSMGIILFCYVEILRTLFRSRSRSKRHHRTVRLILTIVLAHFISWAPYNLVLFLQTLLKLNIIQSCQVSRQLDYAMLICRDFAFCHCCVNPVLYVFVGVKFRRHLKSLLQHFGLCQSLPSPSPHSHSALPYEGASFY